MYDKTAFIFQVGKISVGEKKTDFKHNWYSILLLSNQPAHVPPGIDECFQLLGLERGGPEDGLWDGGQACHVQPIAPAGGSLRQLIEESDELGLHLPLWVIEGKRREGDGQREAPTADN